MSSDDPKLAAAYHKQLAMNRDVRKLHDALAQFFQTDRHCTNCDHFNQASEGCKLAGDKRPPAKIIVAGCEAWEDLIPF